MVNGDCILLENYDSVGKKHYGLIDAGQNTAQSFDITGFLKKHGVNIGDKLDFFLITHCHGDHVGIPDKNGKIKAEYVLERYKIETLYMKEFDQAYSSDGVQDKYEAIIKKAIEKNIKVVGVSPQSLKNKKISPSLSIKLNKNQENQVDNNFKEFNNENISFLFGSAKINLINWEMYYKDGTQYLGGTVPKKNRLKITNENSNSLGVLLTQGNKKAFFGGDLNNTDDGIGGPEDRVKNDIGKVDLLKLNHHGKEGSNTKGFMDVLNPKMVVVSTEIGKIDKDAESWLKENPDVKCLYTTLDSECISATIENDKVYLGFYDTNCFKEINGKIYYIPESKQYSDFIKECYSINYDINSNPYKIIEVKSFDELKQAIDSDEKTNINQNNNKFSLNEEKHEINVKSLLIKLLGSNNNWTANECIIIKENQNIRIITDTNIIIKRGTKLIQSPIFEINGVLDIGKSGMNGNITIDGDGKNVKASNTLIKIEKGTLKLQDNVKICNNVNKISSNNLKKDQNGNLLPTYGTSYSSEYCVFGSGIYCNLGTIDINGGIIENNEQIISLTYVLPETIGKYYHFDTLGSGIYLENHSKLTITKGKISDNIATNKSNVSTIIDKSTTTTSSQRGITQSIYGVGIYSKNSEINLLGGEIARNEGINKAKTTLNKPKSGKTYISSMNNGIYGVGIYLDESILKASNNFKLSANNANLSSSIIYGKNIEISKHFISAIRGVQGYINNTMVNIDGLEIDGKKTNIANKTIINNGEQINKMNVDVTNIGGGLYIKKCNDIQIKNINIHDCKYNNISKGAALLINSSTGNILGNSKFNANIVSDNGGGIYIDSSKIKITNASFDNNTAENGAGGAIYAVSSQININNTKISKNKAVFGGGIYSSSSTTKLNNVTLSENTSNKSGGALYSLNKSTVIYGKNTKIVNNSAKTFGGGIAINKSVVEFKGGTIKNNTAKTYGSGVGIYSGEFIRNGGIVSKSNKIEKKENKK